MSTSARAGRKSVLLVEDDAEIRELVGDFLRDEGYDVVAVDDGGAAIRALHANRPPPDELGLVVLDMMLPVADGVEVLRVLGDLGHYVPVAAMSANREQLRRAYEAGAAATLPKPFDLDGLLDVVQRNCA